MTLSVAPDDESEAPLDDLKSRLVNVDPLLFFFANQTNRKYKIKKNYENKESINFWLNARYGNQIAKMFVHPFLFHFKIYFCFIFFLLLFSLFSLSRSSRLKENTELKGPYRGEREGLLLVGVGCLSAGSTHQSLCSLPFRSRPTAPVQAQ